MKRPESTWPPGGTFADMTPELQRAYAAGLTQAYGAVFDAFAEAFGGTVAGSTSAAAVMVRVQRQWREVEAMLAVEGVLE